MYTPSYNILHCFFPLSRLSASELATSTCNLWSIRISKITMNKFLMTVITQDRKTRNLLPKFYSIERILDQPSLSYLWCTRYLEKDFLYWAYQRHCLTVLWYTSYSDRTYTCYPSRNRLTTRDLQLTLYCSFPVVAKCYSFFWCLPLILAPYVLRFVCFPFRLRILTWGLIYL